MSIIDITRPLFKTMAVWPGDTEYQFDLSWKMSEGATVNVGALNLSIHTGTHVDAPFHFHNEAPTIDRMELTRYVGPAKVIDLEGKEVIEAEHLRQWDLKGQDRVLIRTNSWAEGAPFPEKIPVLSKGAIQYLADCQVKLLGLDVPSVDQIDSKDLKNHHFIYQSDIAILESLQLEHVQPGDYELIALPLAIVGGDGSPVRAILRK